MTYETMEFEVPNEIVKEDIQLYTATIQGTDKINNLEYLSMQNSENKMEQSFPFDELNLLNKSKSIGHVQNSNVEASDIDGLDDFFK